MEENNKVIIFEKKEIIIVLVFVVVLIVTSFTLGIRLGKKLVAQNPAPIGKDVSDAQPAVDFKSNDEESVDKALSEDSGLTDEEKLKKLMEESKSRLNDQLEKFSTTDKLDPAVVEKKPTQENKMAGKFTIQLGSYNSVEEAKQFAEGFTVRGYSPIINEVQIEGKGLWYRVSLGIFNSVEEAKSYVKQEQSLFSGQEHVISEIR